MSVKKIVRIYSVVIWMMAGLSVALQAQDTTQVDPDGYNKFYYENGSVSSEGVMRDGKPDGYWKNYYEDGILKSEGNRKNYLLDSIWKFYDEEGKIVLEINYKEGKKNGFRITYQGDEITKEYFENDVKQDYSYILYPEGSVKMKIPFTDGLEEGVAKEYDLSQNIIQLITYKKGYIVERERINRYDADSLPHGKWKWFYEDEVLHIEGTFKHGLKNGYFKEYDHEGNLISATKYVDGEKIEKAEELVKLEVRTDYYPDGSIKVVGTYKDGIPEGVRREYDEEGEVVKSYIFRHGKIIGEGIFTDEGKKEGFWKEYYPDGTLKAVGSYQADERVGEWKFYFKSGQLEEIGKYVAGQPDSIWRWFYKSGKVLRVENFYNGLQDGIMTEYDEEGNIITQGDYLEGKKDGKWIYQIGDAREEGNYAEGMRNGLWKTYHTDGTVIFEGKFIDDLPNGEHSWYWPNGKLKKQGKYVMGRKNGDWKKFDENGMLIITINYKSGREVKYDGIPVNDTE
ncbi:MAG: hypothetical protein DRI88_05455 [Bacteroidetes bacterium]|nr:MAG: hypothetical protein DRI88_05455 [Bacteroidota bacterium]